MIFRGAVHTRGGSYRAEKINRLANERRSRTAIQHAANARLIYRARVPPHPRLPRAGLHALYITAIYFPGPAHRSHRGAIAFLEEGTRSARAKRISRSEKIMSHPRYKCRKDTNYPASTSARIRPPDRHILIRRVRILAESEKKAQTRRRAIGR